MNKYTSVKYIILLSFVILLHSCGITARRKAALDEAVSLRFEFVDLGLPSGTLWASRNTDEMMSYRDAISNYGAHVPTAAMAKELWMECSWSWDSKRGGAVVRGKNGNSIFLPAEGFFHNGVSHKEGVQGLYWVNGGLFASDGASMTFTRDSFTHAGEGGKKILQSVRLVR